MAVTNKVPSRRPRQEAPMLPGMPPAIHPREGGGRTLIKVHLALDAERTWGLSAHLSARYVDPIWPVVPEDIGPNEAVVVRAGSLSDPKIPFEMLQTTGARLIAIVPDESDESLISAATVGAWAAVPEEESHVLLADVVHGISEGRCPLLEAAADRTGVAFAILAMFDRVDHPAKGRGGGAAGAAGEVALASGRTLRSKGQQTIPAGDRLRLELPGGGGHGDPLVRDAERVAEDVHDGLVSVDAARENYGVALHDDGSVDTAATKKNRTR